MIVHFIIENINNNVSIGLYLFMKKNVCIFIYILAVLPGVAQIIKKSMHRKFICNNIYNNICHSNFQTTYHEKSVRCS